MVNKVFLPVISICIFAFSVSANLSYNLPKQDVALVRAGSFAAFDGAELYDEPGQPALAVYRMTFLVPPNTNVKAVSVTLRGLREVELDGTYDVLPALPPSSRGEIVYPENRAIVDGKDMSVYGSDAFFPAGYVHVSSIGRMNQYSLVEITVFPYRFNPVSRKMVKLGNAELEITTPSLEEGSLTGHAIPSWITSRIKQLAVNYNAISLHYATAERSIQEDPTYAILVSSDVVSSSSSLQSFIDSKKAREFNVKVVTESDWGGGSGDAASDNVRKWLKDNYQSEGIQYALLIGSPDPGSDDIPMKDCYPNGKSGPTDYYFSELSGTWDSDGDGQYGEYDDYKDGDPDKFSEISIGRIPYYGSISDLDHILDKIVAYENTEKDAIDWRMKTLLPMEPSDDNTPGNHMGEYVKEQALDPSNWGYHRIYDETSPGPPETTPCSKDNVLKVWTEDQFGTCAWWTHGNATGAADIMDNTNAAKLDDSHPTFTFQVSCTNSKPEETNNLSYSLLKNGAIAAVGGTRLTWYMPRQTVFNTGSNSSLGATYSIIMVNDSLPAGDAYNKARETLDPSSTNWWTNWVVFVVFGDPSVGAYTCKSVPFIEISSPDGGELWEQGRTFDITWGAYVKEGNVKVELLKENAVEEVLSTSAPPKGPYSWDIPADFPLGDKYTIRVSSLLNDTLIDESDDFFSVTEKTTLTVKAPNGGELIENESELAIRWEYDYDSNVRLDLYLAERLTINITETVANTGSYSWKVPEEIGSGIEYRVRITSVKKSWQYDESDNTFQLQSPAVTEFPYVQPFDEFETSTVQFRDYWEQQDDDDLQWTVWTGMTPSKDPDQGGATGPDGDHTSGSGNYLYVESSSSNNPDKKANCITPIFNLGALKDGTLSFWYHMFSDNEGTDEMGDLYVDISVDGAWKEGVLSFSGNKGDVWLTESFDLKDYIGKLAQFRFRAVTGSGWASDICIDDFKIEGTTNHLPEFTTTADTLARVNEEYTYAMKASDDDNDNLTFDAVTKPAWLTFTDNGDGTGELKGTPQKADVGIHDVTIMLYDGIAMSVKQSFSITVEEEVAIVLDPNTVASSDIEFTVNPNPVDINGDAITFKVSGKRNYSFGQLYIYDVVGNLIYSDEFRDSINPWRLINRNGKKVAGGTYIAFLRLVFEQGEAVVLTQTIGVKDN